MNDFDEVFAKIAGIVSHSVLSIVGITANFILFYAILRHTPSSFKKYSSLLLLNTVNDLICIGLDPVLIVRSIPTPLIVAQLFHGACKFTSEGICYVIFSVYLHTITNSIALTVVSFWYRYYLLRKTQTPHQLMLATIILLMYIPSCIQMITMPFGMLRDAEVYSILSKYYPNLDYDNVAITGNAAAGNIFSDYGILYPMIMPIPCYSFILVVRFRILRMLRRSGSHMSDRTKELHLQLVRTLTYHACLPIFALIADVMITIMMFNIYRHVLMENFVFFFTTVPSCLSPILTLVLIRPYRKFLLREAKSTRRDVTNEVAIIEMESDFPEHLARIAAIVCQSLLAVFGFSANILLMYAIIRHTPASFKKYSSLLFLTAINDTICIVVVEVIIDDADYFRIIPTPIIIAQEWHGACKFISKEACYKIFSVYLHTITNSIALMVVSFWYRHSVLKTSRPPSPIKLSVIIGLLYIPSFVQMVTLPLSTWKDAEVKSALSQYYPNLNYATGPITGNSAHGNIFADYGTLFPMIMPIPSYAFILVVRYKILRALCNADLRMSERTKELHLQLVRTLTYHACLPLFTVIADAMTTIMLLDVYRRPLMENFVFFFASVPSCLSPILTLIVIRPYREFILHQSRKLQPIEPNSAMTISIDHIVPMAKPIA